MIAQPRLVVCDLDGTLVDSNKMLRSASVAAITRLEKAGIQFAVISARPQSGVMPIVSRLGLTGDQAAFNGSLIFRGDGTVVKRQFLDQSVVRAVFELIAQMPVAPWVFAQDRWYVSSGTGEHAAHERISSNQEPIVTHDFSPLYGHVDKLTFVSDDGSMLAKLNALAKAKLGSRATIAQSQVYYLDVTPLAGNKGDGIRALAQSRSIALGDTIAIGDQFNDVAMFEHAGFAIAMGNAPDAVKAHAATATLSNDADGVAHAIDTLILKGKA